MSNKQHNPFDDGAIGITIGLKAPYQTYPCITFCDKEQAIYAYSDNAAVLIDIDGNVLESGNPAKMADDEKQLWITMENPDFGEPLYKQWIESGIKPKE